MNWTTLVSVDELAAALGRPGLVLVDCRNVAGGTDTGAGREAWRRAHIPGAGYAHLDEDLSDKRKPASEGRHPLPDEERFGELLGRLGIGPDDQVVAYDAGDGAMAAARLWWLLRLYGHPQAAVLDGGLAAWLAKGLPVDTREPLPKPPCPGRFDRSQLVDAAQVQARLGQSPGWLLDARAPERFRGEVEPLDPVAGHIPGARNRPFQANLADGRFRPAADLRADFEALLGGHAPGEVVLSCGSGVTACHNLLAMEHAGLSGAKIYAPSWSGWVSDRSRPVATGD
ncbi:sulfurtransferase [Arenimonas caeni]|jgi:thiosulfate/3-mercaptopyruvate sulfurtransferase|uniref:Sulfurtransferase n=1 Tax=Arenimonas caeni TaxID=2058085 RepID=A0A2P6MCB5_9GAMM|nr:sulfurtransferase [Arenimonas caeni]MDY0021140.1 sulfurtransferase [Arenimonas caeni]PRH83643.1 sulfurtransferase [Arenimonas caeni]